LRQCSLVGKLIIHRGPPATAFSVTSIRPTCTSSAFGLRGLGAYPLLGAAVWRYLQDSHIRWAHPRRAVGFLFY
jgi:hypothetical protein